LFLATYTGISARIITAAITKRMNKRQHIAKTGALAAKPVRRGAPIAASGGGVYILATKEY
jgi:hypothetical protein